MYRIIFAKHGTAHLNGLHMQHLRYIHMYRIIFAKHGTAHLNGLHMQHLRYIHMYRIILLTQNSNLS